MCSSDLAATAGHFPGEHPRNLTVSLKAGETIWTESSHKYRADEMPAIADDAGFVCSHQWLENEWGFAESLLVAR